jgi:hypothetical protein
LSFDLDNLLGLLFFVVFVILPIFSRGKRKGQPQQGPTAGRPSGSPGAPTQANSSTRSVPLPGQPTSSADRGSSATITLEEIRRRVEEAQRRELQSRQGTQASTGTLGSPPSAPDPRPARRGLVSSDPFERTLVGGSSPVGMGREGAPSATGTPGATTSPYQSVLGREGVGQVQQTRQTVLGREGALPSGSGRSPGVLGREGLPGREGPTGAARRTQRAIGTPGPLGREGTDRTAKAASAVIGEGNDAMQLQRGRAGSKLSGSGLLQFDERSIAQGLIWHQILGEPPSITRLRRPRSRLH